MNQGLKSYTKQFTHDVSGVGRLAFNMCGAAKNMHMIIPLISTVGIKPINLSLIYNHQDKDVSGQFGKGFRLNLYKKLTAISGGYEVLNADGSVDEYLAANNYYNQETDCTLTIQCDDYFILKDKFENSTEWTDDMFSYPRYYIEKNGTELNIGRIDDEIINFTTQNNESVSIGRSGNTISLFLTCVTTTIIAKTVLTLTDDRITNIKYYEGTTTLVGETEIIYETTAIKLRDVISGTITKFDYTTSGTYKIYDGYLSDNQTYVYPENERCQISYQSQKTVFTNAVGETYTFYFDNNNLLYMEKNQYGDYKYCSYDRVTKNLCEFDNFFLDSNPAEELAFDFENILVIGQEGANATAPVNSVLWNKLNYLNCMGFQEISNAIPMDIEPGDTITLSFWLATYKNPMVNSVNITLSTDEQIGLSNSFFNRENEVLELHSLTFKSIKKSNHLNIKLELTGYSPCRIGGFMASKTKFHTQCTYTGKSLQKVVNGSDVLQYVYEDDGVRIKRIIKNGKTVTENSYNSNKTLDYITDEFGTKTKYGYSQILVNVKENQQIINSANSIKIETKKTYSEDGRFVETIYDETNNETTFEYDSLGRVIKVTDALNFVSETTYLNGLLNALKYNNTTMNQYEYDGRKRLKKVTLPGSRTYEFEYNTQNQIVKIKMDGTVILKYEYDSKGRVSKQQYGETGNYYTFTYDSKDRIIEVFENGNYKYYYEFRNDLLDCIYDEDDRTIRTFIYDDRRRLVKVIDETDFSTKVTSEVILTDYDKLVGKKVKVGTKQFGQSYDEFERSKDLSFSSLSPAKTIGFSGSNLENDGNDVLNLFEVFPLHHDFKSLNKILPSTCVWSNSVDVPFTYDNTIKRFCFNGGLAKIGYNFGNSTSGTIMARVLKTTSNSEYLFGFMDTSGNKIEVLLESNNYVVLHINGNAVASTRMSFSSNVWHTVGLSYGKVDSASSTDTTQTRYYRLFLDGTVKTYSVSAVSDYLAMTSYIGQGVNRNNNFTGLMEMLCFRNAYCEESTLDSLMNSINIISTKTYVDEFRRVYMKEVTKNGSSIMYNIYQYKNDFSSKTAYKIEDEDIACNNTVVVNKHYDYDSLNRITQITETIGNDWGFFNYSYNDRGFLTSDNGTTIEYDTNGNITKYGTTVFEYTSGIKDRLTKVGATVISYNNSDPLLPSAIGSNMLTWTGRRLTRFTHTSGYYDFEYNDEGLRTLKKNHMGRTTRYYYDESRLVTEINPSNRLDFLYDEQGLLFGFILNNANKYFYLRDMLQNIIGIVDEGGNLVVKYSYNAFGKSLSVTDTSGVSIGTINPFRYKGYYYDVETQLFYCNSRYYSPELCRFISPDSIEYLAPQSINGLNLYSYCMNNPIMYADPSGHLPEWAQWLIGGALVVGAIALTICTAGAGGALALALGGGFWTTVASGAFVGALVGAASGALMSAGTQIIANGFEDFSWREVGRGALTGGIAGGIAGGLFAGIQYWLTADKIATGISGINKAKAGLNNAWKPLSNVKNLANMPFSGANIARTVGQAASNYNNAYAAYILAEGTYKIAYVAAKVLYFGFESLTSDLIGLMF